MEAPYGPFGNDPQPTTPDPRTEPLTFEPQGAPPLPDTSRGGPRGRLSRSLIPVMALSLLSATLASIGTVAVLRPSASVVTPSAAPAGSTSSVVNLDSSEAVVQVAAKASPAVVTITSSSVNTRFGPFSVPA